jgi:hypothetical protein
MPKSISMTSTAEYEYGDGEQPESRDDRNQY